MTTTTTTTTTSNSKINFDELTATKVGDELIISGNFKSDSLDPNSTTLTWSCDDPSAVSFGSMSVLGSKEGAIISIPIIFNKSGLFHITVTASDGSTATITVVVAAY